MANRDDWRVMGQARYLKGINLVRRRYRPFRQNPDWDHDHCEFCWAKFMIGDAPDALHEGYTTADDRHWICPRCFVDFKDDFGWVVVESDS